MQLATNFTLRELTRTNHRRWQQHNYEDAFRYEDALRSVATMLQVVRDHYRTPVIIHSGYRCPDLNAAIGGSATSQHMRGEAADFHVVGQNLTDVWQWIGRDSGIDFGQLILEGWTAGQPSWIHLSLGEPWRPAHKCGQVYTWSRGHGYKRVNP